MYTCFNYQDYSCTLVTRDEKTLLYISDGNEIDGDITTHCDVHMQHALSLITDRQTAGFKMESSWIRIDARARLPDGIISKAETLKNCA